MSVLGDIRECMGGGMSALEGYYECTRGVQYIGGLS